MATQDEELLRALMGPGAYAAQQVRPGMNTPYVPYPRGGGAGGGAGAPAPAPTQRTQQNPYGQGGGLRGRFRDAILAAAGNGHKANRMDNVFAARKWDQGMAPEQFDLLTSNRAAQANTRAAQANTRETEKHNLEYAEAKRLQGADLKAWAEIRAALPEEEKQNFMSYNQWSMLGEKAKEGYINKSSGFRPQHDTANVTSTNAWVDAIEAQRKGQGLPEFTPAERGRLFNELFPQVLRGPIKFNKGKVDMIRTSGGDVEVPTTSTEPDWWLQQSPGSSPVSGGTQGGQQAPVIPTVQIPLPAGEPGPTVPTRQSPTEKVGFTSPTAQTPFEVARKLEIDTTAGTAAATKSAEGQAELDHAFRTSAQELIPMLQRQVSDARELRKLIETNEDWQHTGPWEQHFKKWGNKETAKVNADSIFRTLMNLQITKLTPVSNEEIEMVSNLWGSAGNDPEANIGALENAEDRLMGLLTELENKHQYWNKNSGTLKGYNLIDEGSWLENFPASTFNTTGNEALNENKY